MRHNNRQFVVLASQDGIYKKREKERDKEVTHPSSPPSPHSSHRQMVCKIEQLSAVEVDPAGVVATLRIDDESAERSTKQLVS